MELWNSELRSQFPVTGLCTYMDSAYDCGGSLIGKAAAARYFDEGAAPAAEAQRGGPGREVFFRVADETRNYVGQLLGGVPGRNIVITRNTNDGFNIIMQGYDFRPGDNIVTFDREHSAILVPCLHAAKKRGVEIRYARMNPEFNPSIDELWEQVDDRTVMVLVSHVQSLSGFRIDLAELGRRCRERGIFLITDAIQSVGLMPFQAEEWGVSAVSGGAYKGLGAFISIGYLYCCDELLRKVQPTFVSYNFQIAMRYDENDLPYLICTDPLNASKYDNCSSDNLGTYVFHDAAERILQIGTDRIGAHIRRLLTRLYEGLRDSGYTMITPADEDRRCASVCIRTDHAEELYRHLTDQRIVTSLCGKQHVRLSLGAYSNEEDIDRTLAAAAACPWR